MTQDVWERMREFAKQYNIVIMLPKAPPVPRNQCRYEPTPDFIIIDYITLL